MTDDTHDTYDPALAPPSIGATLATLGVLLALTAATVAVAMVGLPSPWDVLAALGIAVAKASFVAAFFMHLRHEPRLVRAFSMAGIGWLMLLLGGLLADLATR